MFMLNLIKHGCFSWENVFGPPQNHSCGQKKPEDTSSATIGVRTATKCCELKRYTDWVRSRTDNKYEVLEGKFRNLNFSPSTKTTTECSFELVLSIDRYLIFFSHVLNFTFVEKKPPFQKQRWSCDFPPRKHRVLHSPSGCLGTPLPLRQSLHGRAAGAYADVTTKISRIDRFPTLLSNGAPLLDTEGLFCATSHPTMYCVILYCTRGPFPETPDNFSGLSRNGPQEWKPN